MIGLFERAGISPAGTRRLLIHLSIVFAVVAAYFLAGKLGQATTNIRSGNVGPVWPAYGIALAALLVCGYRIWVAIAASAFLVAFLTPVPAVVALGQAGSATIAAVTGTFLLRRVRFQHSFARLQDALVLILLGAFGSALVSASLGTLVLYGTQMRSYSGIGSAWLIYWLGDSTGVLLVTPLVLTLPTLLRQRSLRWWIEFAGLIVLLILASMAIFSDVFLHPVTLHVLAFAVLPFVMWAAIRLSTCAAMLANLIIAAIGTIETALGSGPFARYTPFTNAVLLDVFFIILSASGMMLASVIAEREQAQKERERLVREKTAAEMRLRLAAIVESSDDAIIGCDLKGILTGWNKGAEQLYGYAAHEVVGQPISLLMSADQVHDSRNIMEKVKNGIAVRHYETVRRKKDGTCLQVSLTASPIFSADDHVVGVSSIERDITESKRQEQVLRKSEERFRLAVHAGRMFAYEWDPATDIIFRSAESTQILGIDESIQITGKRAIASVHPEDQEELRAVFAALSPRDPYLKFSCRILLKNTPIWIEQCSVAHFDEQGRITRIVGMAADITERKQAEEALALAKRKLIEAQEEERTRIARELHDDIGQRLALLTIELEQLELNSPRFSSEFSQSVAALGQQAKDIANDIQSLSHELHSAKLEYLGITAAVRGFCRDFAKNQRVNIDCEINDLPAEVEPAVSLCLFRVLQEALHNSLKHSGAGHFEVRLWSTKDKIHLTIRDSGAGFDRNRFGQSRGLGLISMEERVKLLKGKFSIESKPHRGTTVHVQVPVVAGKSTIRVAG
ncbi:MAG TPA: PAS domain S-box protein [Candidatus Angelobacter sp.]|nr:PAS domain S-box protein [Candidatus Angelobacter sp.]